MKRRLFLLKTSLFLGSAYFWQDRWNYIVIHHSAGGYGNIEFLQKVHRERQANDPIHAIPYHYIVGNGHGMGMGEVASDWRQTYHLWGSHVSAQNLDYNFRGIGICVIGNYETGQIPAKQYQALVALTKRLMSTHQIPSTHVTGHGFLTGEATKCPGKNFPMETFLQDIRRA